MGFQAQPKNKQAQPVKRASSMIINRQCLLKVASFLKRRG